MMKKAFTIAMTAAFALPILAQETTAAAEEQTPAQ